MLHFTKFVAVISSAIFAGAAIYINLVEHPARMSCGTQIAATVWAPSYKRATVMQAPLAILSFLAGVSAWLLGGSIMWCAGAVLIALVVPFTFIAIMPTNHLLLAPGRDLASNETRALLIKWSRLHAVRSLLSLLALVVYLILLLQA
jgi:anthrone oxygenase-like protein